MLKEEVAMVTSLVNFHKWIESVSIFIKPGSSNLTLSRQRKTDREKEESFIVRTKQCSKTYRLVNKFHRHDSSFSSGITIVSYIRFTGHSCFDSPSEWERRQRDQLYSLQSSLRHSLILIWV